MTIYYVDYENVNSQGLKGVEHLTENDEVNILYSKKADNVKIDILTALMASKASIRFIPVHVGTPNALDFQLITLLFLHYTKENRYFIISKDCGYDCCIKTALELGADTIARCENIEISLAAPSEYRSRRRSRRRGQDSAYADFTGRSFQNPQQQASSAPDNPRTEPVIPGSSQSAADQWIRTAMPGGAMQLVRNEEELNSYSSEPLPPSVAALASAYSQQEDMQNTADSSESAAGELPSENLREAFAEGPLSAFPEDAAAEMNLQAASEEKTPDELPQEQISEKNTGFAVSEESAGFAAPEESAGFAAPEESAGFTALTEDSADSAPAEEKTDFISAESGTAITPAEEKEGFAAFSEDSLPEKLPGSDFIIDAPAEDDFASAMPMPTFRSDLTEEEAEIFIEDSTASARRSSLKTVRLPLRLPIPETRKEGPADVPDAADRTGSWQLTAARASRIRNPKDKITPRTGRIRNPKGITAVRGVRTRRLTGRTIPRDARIRKPRSRPAVRTSRTRRLIKTLSGQFLISSGKRVMLL